MFFSLISEYDLKLFKIINQSAGLFPFFDRFAIFCAKYLGYFLILSLFFLLIKNRKKYQTMVLQSYFSALFSRLIVVNIIRWLFPRERPFVSYSVNLLFHHSQEKAFPSGHAGFYFALSTVVYLYNKKAGLLFYFLSFLICFFRVFAGVHWPSDILAGMIAGIFSGWLIVFFFQKILPHILRREPQEK